MTLIRAYHQLVRKKENRVCPEKSSEVEASAQWASTIIRGIVCDAMCKTLINLRTTAAVWCSSLSVGGMDCNSREMDKDMLQKTCQRSEALMQEE